MTKFRNLSSAIGGLYATRAILVLNIVSGVFSVYYLYNIVSFDAKDFDIYYYTVQNSINGQPFAGVSPRGDLAAYGTPPLSVLVYYPFTIFSKSTSYIILLLLTSITLFIAGILVTRYLDPVENANTYDKLLVIGVMVLSPPSVLIILQTKLVDSLTIILFILCVVGYRDNGELPGVALATATSLKAFPVFIVTWLGQKSSKTNLIYFVYIGGLLFSISLLLFGLGEHLSYIQNMLSFKSYSGPIPPNAQIIGLSRPFSIFFPKLSRFYLLIILVFISAFNLWIKYKKQSHLITFLTTLIVVIFIIPSTPHYTIYAVAFVLPLIYYSDYIYRAGFLIGLSMALSTLMLGDILFIITIPFIPQALQKFLESIATPIFTLSSAPTYGLIIILVTSISYGLSSN